MNGFLARYLDGWTIQYAALRMRPADHRHPRLAEALEFLNGADFIPAGSEPARPEFLGPVNFRFPTLRPSECRENNTVHGRLYQCPGQWRDKPVVLLLHGGSDFINHRFRFPLIARACHRMGFNAATLELPWHFQRHPRRNWIIPGPDVAGIPESPAFPFPRCRFQATRNYLRLAEAMAQGVSEIRALAGWLLGEGCSRVALWGISLGGWLAGMAIRRDPRMFPVVLNAPGVYFDFPFGRRAFSGRIRREWLAQSAALDLLNQTPLNVALAKPVISREDILLIEGTHDLLVPRTSVERLWEAWERPGIWRLPHGHATVCCGGVPGLAGKVLRWIKERVTSEC